MLSLHKILPLVDILVYVTFRVDFINYQVIIKWFSLALSVHKFHSSFAIAA